MSIQNLLRSNNLLDPIYNSYSDRLFCNNMFTQTTIVGPITVTPVYLEPNECINSTIILNTDCNVITLAKASDVLALIPNAVVGTTFNINFINYGSDPGNLANSIDGSFTMDGPADIVIQPRGSATTQETRNCVCIVSALSPAHINIY